MDDMRILAADLGPDDLASVFKRCRDTGLAFVVPVPDEDRHAVFVQEGHRGLRSMMRSVPGSYHVDFGSYWTVPSADLEPLGRVLLQVLHERSRQSPSPVQPDGMPPEAVASVPETQLSPVALADLTDERARVSVRGDVSAKAFVTWFRQALPGSTTRLVGSAGGRTDVLIVLPPDGRRHVGRLVTGYTGRPRGWTRPAPVEPS